MQYDKVSLLDPSLLLRPEQRFAKKELNLFRDYSEDDTDPIKRRVKETYRLMHVNQTVDFVEGNNVIYRAIVLTKKILF